MREQPQYRYRTTKILFWTKLHHFLRTMSTCDDLLLRSWALILKTKLSLRQTHWFVVTCFISAQYCPLSKRRDICNAYMSIHPRRHLHFLFTVDLLDIYIFSFAEIMILISDCLQPLNLTSSILCGQVLFSLCCRNCENICNLTVDDFPVQYENLIAILTCFNWKKCS